MKCSFLLFLCIIISSIITAYSQCGVLCPLGNNDCQNGLCSRCFPINTPSQRCITGAQCGELCDADTDCIQEGLCMYCRLNRCSAECGKSCLTNQDCNINQNCRSCDPDAKVCIMGELPLPGVVALNFTKETGKSNGNWYYPNFCSVPTCSVKSTGSSCKPDPGVGLVFTMTKCSFGMDCVCKGTYNKDQPNCYNKTLSWLTSGVISGIGYGPGQFDLTMTAPQGSAGLDDNVQAVFALRTNPFLTIHDEYTPGALSVELVISHIQSAPQNYWSTELFVKNTTTGQSSTCANALVPVSENLAASTNTYTIIWSTSEIIWQINGNVLASFPGTSNCPIPEQILYATFSLWPIDPTITTSISSYAEVYDFNFTPLTKI